MIALVLVSLLAAGVLSSPIINQDLNEEWETFKTFHNRQYSMKEELYRRSIWEANVKVIQKHNREYDMNRHTYTLGVNEFTDMTSEEFVSQMNGYRGMNRTKNGMTFMAPSNVGDDPVTVDWRDKGYVTEVKNQEQCGSCWAFSTTGSLEGQHFKATGKLVSLSEQNLVDCSRAEGNKGCQGGLMDDAFKYIKKNGGIDTEASYPYKGKNGKCHFKPADVGATDTGFVDIPEGSESALKTAVATIGPISVAIDASHQSFQLYRSGVYNEARCSRTKLDHGVLAVGYGTMDSKDYWLVKNSWGATWGQKGYIFMSRDKNNQCGIATSASYPTV